MNVFNVRELNVLNKKFIKMTELVDFTLQQHIAHEIYRHQMLQRLPGKEWEHSVSVNFQKDLFADVDIC